jgi:hypothetical protein
MYSTHHHEWHPGSHAARLQYTGGHRDRWHEWHKGAEPPPSYSITTRSPVRSPELMYSAQRPLDFHSPARLHSGGHRDRWNEWHHPHSAPPLYSTSTSRSPARSPELPPFMYSAQRPLDFHSPARFHNGGHRDRWHEWHHGHSETRI